MRVGHRRVRQSCLTAMLVAGLIWSVACDRVQRDGDDTDKAVEKKPVLTTADFAGTWKVVAEDRDYDFTDATGKAGGDSEDQFKEGAGTNWVRLQVAEVDKETPDVGEDEQKAAGDLKAALCDTRGCDPPLTEFRLEKAGEKWTTQYGTARIHNGPIAGSFCRMSVFEWSLRPKSDERDEAGLSRLEFVGVEQRGRLTLEGEARCRGADAVELRDRLDIHFSRMWQLRRAPEVGSEGGVEPAEKDAGR